MTEPITNLCIVADIYRCPPKYELLLRSHDKKEDCDLWKDGMFRAKSLRYICISRDTEASDSVITDVIIQNEKEVPPPGYTLIERTLDSSEKAVRKKQICVKMVPRNTTECAVTDLILLSRSKRAPAEYILTGEINGLCLCIKMGNTQTSESAGDVAQAAVTSSSHSSPALGYLHRSEMSSGSRSSTPTMGLSNGMLVMNHSAIPAVDNYQYNTPATVELHNPLADVPFHLHPKLVSDNSGQRSSLLQQCKTIADIQNEYSYTFTLEYSMSRQLPTCRD